jgi:hypothetical protein
MLATSRVTACTNGPLADMTDSRGAKGGARDDPITGGGRDLIVQGAVRRHLMAWASPVPPVVSTHPAAPALDSDFLQRPRACLGYLLAFCSATCGAISLATKAISEASNSSLSF